MAAKVEAAGTQQLPAAYPAFRVFVNSTNVAIQPKEWPGADSSAPVETLSIDLTSGSMQVLMKARFPGQGTPVLSVLGLIRLYAGYALVVITAARRVATLSGCDIFRMEGADIITGARTSRENRLLLKLLADAVDPEGSGRDMYFSYTYDVTTSSQRQAALSDVALASRPLSLRADPKFTWNGALLRPFLEAGAARFVVPTILGFVEQLPGLSFTRGGARGSGTTSGTLTLIARRSPHRAGTRHWRRGCDQDGHAANFAETEQIVVLEGAVSSYSSYVQIRGSIPLLWTEMPNLKYKPTRIIASRTDNAPVFDRHMRGLLEQYKSTMAINLVNQKGGEGKLEASYRGEAARFCSSVSSELHYLPFDFHHECKKRYAHGLALLWSQVASDFAAHGFFLIERKQVVRRQEGVMRSNCVDCLDRTNVVQGILARKSLEMVLRHYDLMSATESLPDAFPAVEQQFKILWADHGDAISMQYAGTGAMKSGFTRTGKRTYGGLVDDGVKSVTRYYLNNFQDGRKQDALDLFTGQYVVDTKVPLSSQAQPSPLVPLGCALLAIALALRSSAHVVALEGGRLSGSLLRGVLVPLVLGAVLLMYVLKNGKFLVNRPQLCLQAAYTARKPGASTAAGASGSK